MQTVCRRPGRPICTTTSDVHRAMWQQMKKYLLTRGAWRSGCCSSLQLAATPTCIKPCTYESYSQFLHMMDSVPWKALAKQLLLIPAGSAGAVGVASVVGARLLCSFRWRILYIVAFAAIAIVGTISGGVLGLLSGLSHLIMRERWGSKFLAPLRDAKTADFVELARRVRDTVFLVDYLRPPLDTLWSLVLRWSVFGAPFLSQLPTQLERMVRSGDARTVEDAVRFLLADRVRAVQRSMMVMSLLALAVPIGFLKFLDLRGQ